MLRVHIVRIAALVFFVLCFENIFSQDKIYKKEGGIIEGKIQEVANGKITYKTKDSEELKQITVEEVDLLKYASGRTTDFSKPQTAAAKTEGNNSPQGNSDNPFFTGKFDRNSPEFVNYANSVAKQMSQPILLKMAGKIENSSVGVYFDSVYRDLATGEINIPIKITYEKYVSLHNGYIKGTIKIKPDGTKTWVFESAANE